MNSAEEIIIQQMAFLHEESKNREHIKSVIAFSRAIAELARVIPLVRQNSACEKSQSGGVDFPILPYVTLKASDINELFEVRKGKFQQAEAAFQQILNGYQKS